jgi:RNA polymerase sigma-70 factor (ECF subfamily)
VALRLDDVDLVRDRTLVEQFQAGDPAGFEDLYRRYYGRLYRFCLKRVGDPHDAEELTQESFVRAFRALDTFGGERRFYPWLSVIAARLCVDNHRRRARTEPSADIDTGVTEGGQERVVDEVDRELLAQALARLGPRHREVLRLREEQGWSYQHIASHYDVSLGTVEALLWRARRALRREFIAVAGSDAPGGLAAIPVVGWLVRRVNGARLRVGQWADAAFPALANGAVAMAVVVGSSAGMTALVHSGSAAAAAPAISTPASLTLVSPNAAAPSSPAAPPAAASAAHGGGAATAPSEVTQVGSVKIIQGEEAQKDYDSQPIRVAVGDSGASLDPQEALRELRALAENPTGSVSK